MYFPDRGGGYAPYAYVYATASLQNVLLRVSVNESENRSICAVGIVIKLFC